VRNAERASLSDWMVKNEKEKSIQIFVPAGTQALPNVRKNRQQISRNQREHEHEHGGRQPTFTPNPTRISWIVTSRSARAGRATRPELAERVCLALERV